MFKQLLSQGKLLRLPSAQSLYHVTCDDTQAVHQSKALAAALAVLAAVWGRETNAASPVRHTAEGHLRNGEIMDGLNEWLP